MMLSNITQNYSFLLFLLFELFVFLLHCEVVFCAAITTLTLCYITLVCRMREVILAIIFKQNTSLVTMMMVPLDPMVPLNASMDR